VHEEATEADVCLGGVHDERHDEVRALGVLGGCDCFLGIVFARTGGLDVLGVRSRELVVRRLSDGGRGESGDPEREAGARQNRSGSSATRWCRASTMFDVAVQGAVLYYASGESVKSVAAPPTLEWVKSRQLGEFDAGPVTDP
jgi:hypothetical protein